MIIELFLLGGIFMRNVLESILKTKWAGIYTNIDETDKFNYGMVIAVGLDDFAIYEISPDGKYDGVVAKKISSVIKIETDSEYIREMLEKTPDSELRLFDMPSDAENVSFYLLESAMKTQKIVSIELADCGYFNAVGFVKNITETTVQILQVTNDGDEDGFAYVPIDIITEVSYFTEDEQKIQKCWQIRVNKK